MGAVYFQRTQFYERDQSPGSCSETDQKASPLISRLKLHASQLVGRGEIELLEKYAPSVPKIHNATAMNEVTSRRIINAKTAVASALGSVLREYFIDHAAYTRTLHVAKSNDQSHVPNVESEREAAISTPCMSPLHAFVHNLAAPSIALRSGTEIGSKITSKLKAIDEALPNAPPNHIGDLPSRAANLKYKTATQCISEMDYKTTVHGEESSDPIKVSRVACVK